jgi:cytoplasmic iron level regulating protein YaaA (DUF328/UPF0246 family)
MASRLPLILLPPSEGKAPGGDGPPWAAGTMAVDLDDRRRQVIAALGTAMRRSAAERSKLLGVKGAALDAATGANRAVASAATMPAIDRYTGVLYDALDAPTLSAAARRRLGSSVLIASGLWGLVAPTDRIPDYKLKMSVALPRLGRLATWWRPAVTEVLAARAQGRLVWDLLPNEHSAAWDPGPDVRRVSATFLERRPDGRLVRVSHWNKHLKGALVRQLLEHPRTGPDDLVGWHHPSGYRLDPERTVIEGGRTVLTFVGS